MATLTNSYQYIGRSNAVGCSNGYNYYILLYAKTSGDTSTGKHTVTVKQRLVCAVNSSFYGWSTSGSATIAGESAFSWSWANVPGAAWNSSSITEGGVTYPSWVDLKEGSVVVNIGYGVTKNITISSSWVRKSSSNEGYLPYRGTEANVSVTVTLPMIATASTITSATNIALGNKCDVTWTPGAVSFRYKLKFSVGDWSYTTAAIHPNKTTAYTYTGYTIPMEVARQITSGRERDMTVTLYTYSDSNATVQIGAASSKTFKVSVPETDETKPTLDMTLSPVSSLAAPFNTLYIQGLTKVKADLIITTRLGATVSASNITVEGATYASPYTSDFLSQSGDQVVKGSVKDSRAYYGTYYRTITVIPYSKPRVLAVNGESNVVVARCDADGNLSDSGTYLKIKARRDYAKVMSGGVQNNFCKIQYRYKSEGDTSYSNWVTILDSSSLSSDEVVTGALLNGTLAIDTNYIVQVQVIDDLGQSAFITQYVPSEEVYMDRPAGGKGMGLGGYCTADDQLDVYWKIKARAGLSCLNETGDEIKISDILFPKGQVPDGWDPNAMNNGAYVVTAAKALKDPKTNAVLCYNGIFVQIQADVGGSVKLQLVFPTDTLPPAYRLKWYSNWSDWTKF